MPDDQVLMQQRLNPLRLFFEILACVSMAALAAMLLLPRLALSADSSLTLPTSSTFSRLSRLCDALVVRQGLSLDALCQ